MGETACFVHLSNPSYISHEDSEATQAPDGSISFGRFATDSLAWEKWSSFSHNRYLEEVERYKNPGSVAQKKAYFEAHYKRIAAQRAAKLLEQSNAASSNVPDSDRADLIQREVEPEIDDGASNGNGNQHYESSNLGGYRIDQSHIVNSSNQFTESDNYVPVDRPEEVKGSAADSSFSLDANESDSDEKPADSETKMAEETVSVREEKIFTESQTQNGPSQQIGDIENHGTVSELETNKTNQVGKPPLKESLAANQEISDGNKKKQTGVSSWKSSDLCRSSKTPPAPPAKPAAPIYSRKENIATPNSRRSPWDSVDKKRSTPNSLHMSLNVAPSHSTETFPSKTNQRVLVLDKIGDSKTSVDLSKPSNDSLKSPNPPTKISSNGVPNHATAVPRLENRRKNTLQENQIVQSQKKDRKWFSLSVDSSRSSNHKGSKAGSKFLSCFNLRSEERATKQKELEERANAKEGEKEETKFELKKLRQILGFKAKPMPDFYHETEPTNNHLKKIPLTRPRSPKLGRKTNASPVQDGTSLPPRPPVKSNGSKTTIASFLNKKTH